MTCIAPTLACMAFVLAVMIGFAGCSYAPAFAQDTPTVWLVDSPCDDLGADLSPGDCIA